MKFSITLRLNFLQIFELFRIENKREMYRVFLQLFSSSLFHSDDGDLFLKSFQKLLQMIFKEDLEKSWSYFFL